MTLTVTYLSGRRRSSNMAVLVLFLLSAHIRAAASRDPTFLWPMDESSYNTEVIQNPPSTVNKSLCSTTFGDQPPEYPNKVQVMDGSGPIDLILDHTTSIDTSKDYSFSMMVNPSTETATLLHYKPTDQSQPFRDMILYIDNGNIAMKRSLDTKVESSRQSTNSVSSNSWHFVSFGIDINKGEHIIQVDGTSMKKDDQFKDSVEIVLPGVLRVGGAFDFSHPNFIGTVACVGFYLDVKEPAKQDAENLCKAAAWNSNVPDCSPTEALNRSSTGSGYFERGNNLQLSTLNLILSRLQCSHFRCALSCLQHNGCWYYRYNKSAPGCQLCNLYDSSIVSWKGTGEFDHLIFKWRTG